jgi:hypothetical protein
MPMRAQREEQAKHVRDDQDHRDLDTQRPLGQSRRGRDDEVEDRGNEQGDGTEHEQCRAQSGRRAVELLALELHAAPQRARAEHEQQVADDRTRDGRFHQVEQPGTQGDDRDDELCGVAERRVEQPPDSFAESLCELLGGSAHQGGERDDRRRGREEDPELGLHGIRIPAGERWGGTRAGGEASSPWRRVGSLRAIWARESPR